MTNNGTYYNDNDPFICEWVRNLIKKGLVPDGEVDERSIENVKPEEIKGFIQHHFCCGICGWPLALNLAGWPADRSILSASFPCQPFSCAGSQKGGNDKRHIWPEGLRIISELHPGTIFGEQVPGAIGWGWLDAVFDDLEENGYTCGALVLPACSIGAPHIRQRIYWVANLQKSGRGQFHKHNSKSQARGKAVARRGYVGGRGEDCERLAHAKGRGQRADGCPAGQAAGGAEQRQQGGAMANAADTGCGRPDEQERGQERRAFEEWLNPPWSDSTWLACLDGKIRQVPLEPAFQPVADGFSGSRVGVLRAAGNAISPPAAAMFIKAYLETEA